MNLRPSLCALLLLMIPATGRLQGSEVARRVVNDGNVVLEGIPTIPEELVRDLQRYQSIRSASFGAWHEAGKGIFVTTRFGDVEQIHYVAMPGGARRQITFRGEPVKEAYGQPAGPLLAFLSDEGGSELYQIYLLDSTTGDYRRISDGESRNGAVSWSPDGRRIAFTSTRRNGRSNDVWIMPADEPSSARLAVESPDGSAWAAAAWSRDGRRLLIQQYVSITDSRIHLLEVGNGRLRRLAGGGENPGAHLAAGFDPDEEGIFLVTDRQSDFRRLAHLDLATGSIRTLTDAIPWDVGKVELSRDGRRAAFTVNEGSIDQLYLFDSLSRAYRHVPGLPSGVIQDLELSPNGRRLAITLSTPINPKDVFSLDLAEDPLESLGLTRWTFSEVGGLDTTRFSTPELIHYPTFDRLDGAQRQIPAFLYRPRGEPPHPVILYIHGGPESQFRPRFRSIIQMFLDYLGVAVIAPNVRGSSGYGKEYVQLDNAYRREDSVRDIGALLDWIADQPELDSERVAVYGGSYGGYMVLASLVHHGHRLRAGVERVGISNFVTFLENTKGYRRDLRRVEYGDERDPEMRAFLEKISPTTNAEKIRAPLFVAQGANDPRVPVTESDQIVHEVRQAGYEVWYMKALNEGHGFDKKRNRDLFGQAAVLFFQVHLGAAPE